MFSFFLVYGKGKTYSSHRFSLGLIYALRSCLAASRNGNVHWSTESISYTPMGVHDREMVMIKSKEPSEWKKVKRVQPHSSTD